MNLNSFDKHRLPIYVSNPKEVPIDIERARLADSFTAGRNRDGVS